MDNKLDHTNRMDRPDHFLNIEVIPPNYINLLTFASCVLLIFSMGAFILSAGTKGKLSLAFVLVESCPEAKCFIFLTNFIY